MRGGPEGVRPAARLMQYPIRDFNSADLDGPGRAVKRIGLR